METESINYDSLSNKDHARVSLFMNKEAGIQLPTNKKNLIETRLRKRQRALQFNTLSEYIDYALVKSEQEQIHFIDALTTNKTEFFREANHYPFFVDYLANAKSDEEVRVWSAGCSSGEEPYSLAMLASDNNHCQVSIMATDISVSMLQRAKRAIYPHNTVTPIPPALRNRYLLRRKTPSTDEIKIAPGPRKLVSFKTFNLITGQYKTLPQFDVIFCRNVMIYFDAEQRDNITRQFCRRLKPGGLLFIGHSETLKNEKPKLRPIAPTIYQREAV